MILFKPLFLWLALAVAPVTYPTVVINSAVVTEGSPMKILVRVPVGTRVMCWGYYLTKPSVYPYRDENVIIYRRSCRFLDPGQLSLVDEWHGAFPGEHRAFIDTDLTYRDAERPPDIAYTPFIILPGVGRTRIEQGPDR